MTEPATYRGRVWQRQVVDSRRYPPLMQSRTLPFDPIAEAHRQWVAHDWAAAAPGMAAITSIMRVHQIFIARVDEVLRPFGLTFARYETLMLLRFSRRGSLPLGKLGERLQVHAASVTNAVDRLEADGLVRRVPNPDDGRGTLAEITPKGKALVLRATRQLNKRVFVSVGLGEAKLVELFQLLANVRRGAGDFR